MIIFSQSARGVVNMKSRSKELLDRAISAMVAAIEIYNKPCFPYRTETFAILAINSWELLLKAKWLADNNNKDRSLHVLESRNNADGSKSKKSYIKRTRSGNPLTHSIDYLVKKLVEKKILNQDAGKNIQVLLELRDSSVHFYNQSSIFSLRLQELGIACVKNFTASVTEWFDRGLSEFNLYLMPLSFVDMPNQTEGILFNNEEKNFLKFLEGYESKQHNPNSPYSVTVNIEVHFVKSKAKDSLAVQLSNDPNATEIRLTDEQIFQKYPWDYKKLTNECKKRYADFKQDKKYHEIRNKLASDSRYGNIRFLDPSNQKSSKKTFFTSNILKEFDKQYQRTNEAK